MLLGVSDYAIITDDVRLESKDCSGLSLDDGFDGNGAEIKGESDKCVADVAKAVAGRMFHV